MFCERCFAELEEWVPRIESLIDSADSLHLMMNNCYENYGMRSAGYLADACQRIKAARPTAVNLFWALERCRRVHEAGAGGPVEAAAAALEAEAEKNYSEREAALREEIAQELADRKESLEQESSVHVPQHQ